MKDKQQDYFNQILKHLDKYHVRKTVNENLSNLALIVKKNKDIEILIQQMLHYEDSAQTIRSQWRVILDHTGNINLISLLGKDDVIRKEMLQNIPWFIQYADFNNAGEIVYQLSKLDASGEAIAHHFEALNQYCFIHKDCLYVPLLQFRPEMATEKVKKNFEVLKLCGPEEFFSMIKAMKNVKGLEMEYQQYIFWANLYSQLQMPQCNQYQKENVGSIFRQIIYDKDDIRREKQMIIEAVLAQENMDSHAPCIQTQIGYNSIVLKIGDKIIKMGRKKEFEIPYHPKIMMPKFRKKYKTNRQFMPNFILEVFDYGMVEPTDVSDEELLNIFQTLEEAGIFWGDAKKDNVVRLKEDNTIAPYIKGEDFNMVGFLKDERFPTEQHQVLKKGELVISDLDFLQPESQINHYSLHIDKVILRYMNANRKKKKMYDLICRTYGIDPINHLEKKNVQWNEYEK